MDIKSKAKQLFVAAIDIGTTYSGFAFSSKDNWRKILGRRQKERTALLLNSKADFIAFGEKAESDYADLVGDEDGNHSSFYYFLDFKMILHEGLTLNRNTCCVDVLGKKLDAITVFSHCVRYLKDDLLNMITVAHTSTVTVEDIDFVLTVPAIWSDKAKQLMKEAAKGGGIKENQLTIALEPEAASIYGQFYIDDKYPESQSNLLGVMETGTQYIVCDLGGGTADITVHEKCEDQTLKEIIPASGGSWGGQSVNGSFLTFLVHVFGENVVDKFKTENVDDYLYFYNAFELQKKNFKPGSKDRVSLNVPLTFRAQLGNDKTKHSMENAIKKSIYADKVFYDATLAKLHFNAALFESFFTPTVNCVVQHLDSLFRQSELENVNTILMVGGFSNCKLVQNVLRQTFETKRFITPQECDLTVLMGAVYFGHIPSAISRRSLRYTYGVQSWLPFDPSKHPQSKKITVDNSVRCKDIFFKYATKGENVPPGCKRSHKFQGLARGERQLKCILYTSDKEDPKYVDDKSCKPIGILIINLSDSSMNRASIIEETIIFGETELRMRAENMDTKQIEEITFDLLSDYGKIQLGTTVRKADNK